MKRFRWKKNFFSRNEVDGGCAGVSTIRVSGWVKESVYDHESSLIPLAHANGTDSSLTDDYFFSALKSYTRYNFTAPS